MICSLICTRSSSTVNNYYSPRSRRHYSNCILIRGVWNRHKPIMSSFDRGSRAGCRVIGNINHGHTRDTCNRSTSPNASQGFISPHCLAPLTRLHWNGSPLPLEALTLPTRHFVIQQKDGWLRSFGNLLQRNKHKIFCGDMASTNLPGQVRDFSVPHGLRGIWVGTWKFWKIGQNSSSLHCTAKVFYFTRMSVKIYPNELDFGETQWITLEDVDVEHLFDVFMTIDANSDGIWDTCISFGGHLSLHKKRLTALRPRLGGLPDNHRTLAEPRRTWLIAHTTWLPRWCCGLWFGVLNTGLKRRGLRLCSPPTLLRSLGLRATWRNVEISSSSYKS